MVFFYFFFRGQESAGIVLSEGTDPFKFNQHKGMGLVSQVFKDDHVFRKLRGNLGIGRLDIKILEFIDVYEFVNLVLCSAFVLIIDIYWLQGQMMRS